MVVVMRNGATEADVERVVAAVTGVGGECFVSSGRHQTIVGLVGDLSQFAELPLHADELQPMTEDEHAPFPSYYHAAIHMLRSLTNPRVGAQWNTTKPS
jgi:hypothetical protein